MDEMSTPKSSTMVPAARFSNLKQCAVVHKPAMALTTRFVDSSNLTVADVGSVAVSFD